MNVIYEIVMSKKELKELVKILKDKGCYYNSHDYPAWESHDIFFDDNIRLVIVIDPLDPNDKNHSMYAILYDLETRNIIEPSLDVLFDIISEEMKQVVLYNMNIFDRYYQRRF
jgi:hypothetical protein